MGFYHSQENMKSSYWKQDQVCKTASKKVVHKAGEFLGNKIADKVTKSKYDEIVKPDANPANVEEIVIPLEKMKEILNELRKVL